MGQTVEERAADLNPVLRGWGRYFCYGNSTQKFHQIDSYVPLQLAILASRKHGRSGINWGNRFDYWSAFSRLGVYRLTGTVRYRNAYASQ